VLRVSTPAWCPFCLSRAPLAARVDYQTGLYRPVHAGDPNPASNQKAGTLADRDFEVGYLSRLHMRRENLESEGKSSQSFAKHRQTRCVVLA